MALKPYHGEERDFFKTRSIVRLVNKRSDLEEDERCQNQKTHMVRLYKET